MGGMLFFVLDVAVRIMTCSMEQSSSGEADPCSRVLLEKLTDSQLVKKFAAQYGTRRFITALTSVRHLLLPSACNDNWALKVEGGFQ